MRAWARRRAVLGSGAEIAAVLSIDDNFVRRADVLARETPEGAVLVDMMSGQCWELNRIGATLWSLLESPVSLRQVC
jgi:hypothetical protein